MHHLNFRLTAESNKWGPGTIQFVGIGNYPDGALVNINFTITSGPTPRFLGWYDDVDGTIPSTAVLSSHTQQANSISISGSEVVLFCKLAP